MFVCWLIESDPAVTWLMESLDNLWRDSFLETGNAEKKHFVVIHVLSS